MVRVGVVGAMGKMGQEVVKAVCNDDTLELVCSVDVNQIDMEVCPPKSVRIIGNLKSAIEMHKPDVMVDFTQPKYVFENACRTDFTDLRRGVFSRRENARLFGAGYRP